eukprot:95558_1
MDEALKALTTINFDPNLKDIQDGSIATMQMFSKTFGGILIAFQQQINKDKEHEEKLCDIYNKIENIDSALIQTNKSIEIAVNNMDNKLQKQETNLNNKLIQLEKNVTRITKGLENKCESMMYDVSKQLTESAKNVENVSNELNKYAVSLDSMSNKVETTLNEVNEKQENIESQIIETQNMVNDKILEIEEKVTENKKYVMEKIRGVTDKFQNLRFEVDQIAAKKADVEDLKRKANKDDLNELNKTVSNITNIFNENIDEINNKIDVNYTKFEKDISENKQNADETLSNFDEEINRINSTLGELEYKFTQKNKENNNTINGNGDDILSMIHELQNNMDELSIANSKNNKQPIMGATSSGSCFSCGQRVNSFPALPSRHRSPDKKNIGGGFTYQNHNDKKSPTSRLSNKFNDKMRNELVQIATDLASPQHKFPVERKPVKLPKLTKSNTTSQL